MNIKILELFSNSKDGALDEEILLYLQTIYEIYKKDNKVNMDFLMDVLFIYYFNKNKNLEIQKVSETIIEEYYKRKIKIHKYGLAPNTIDDFLLKKFQ